MKTILCSRPGRLLVLVTVLATFLTSCSKEAAPQYLVGTGGVQGNYQTVGLTLARITNQSQLEPSFLLKTVSSSGSVANINAISTGDHQFGIAQADHQHQAVKGLGDWSEKGPQKELRTIFNIFVESVTLVAGADSGIKSIGDLRRKTVDIGAVGSGTRQNAIDALRAAGIDWKTDINASEQALDDRLTNFMHGDIDAFFYTAAHPNREIKFATFSVRGARIIPLENIDNIISENAFLSRVVIPSDTYPRAFMAKDVETLGVNATLLTSASVSTDVVYTVTKAIFENLNSLAEYDASFNALLNKNITEGITAPLHPGALKYYEEIGLK